jgi:hypothetical protein
MSAASERAKAGAEGSVLMGLLMQLSFDAFFRPEGRHRADLAGCLCLIVVRRYMLIHSDTPADLPTAVREAGLSVMPTDPFSGQPMRYKVLDGRPVVYSVGVDLRDDGGAPEQFRTATETPRGNIVFRIGN